VWGDSRHCLKRSAEERLAENMPLCRPFSRRCIRLAETTALWLSHPFLPAKNCGPGGGRGTMPGNPRWRYLEAQISGQWNILFKDMPGQEALHHAIPDLGVLRLEHPVVLVREVQEPVRRLPVLVRSEFRF
jgi:hypothetical protein